MKIYCTIVDYMPEGMHHMSDIEYVGTDEKAARQEGQNALSVWVNAKPVITIQVWENGGHIGNLNDE